MSRHVLLLALLVVCAYTDVAQGKIYDVVTYGALFAAAVLGILAQESFARYGPFYATLASAGLGGGIFGLVCLRGGMLLGDVKYMAAVGALAANVELTLLALILSSIVGFIMALGLLIWHGRLVEGLRTSVRLFVSLGRTSDGHGGHRPSLTMPYGLAISLGAMWAWFSAVSGV